MGKKVSKRCTEKKFPSVYRKSFQACIENANGKKSEALQRTGKKGVRSSENVQELPSH